MANTYSWKVPKHEFSFMKMEIYSIVTVALIIFLFVWIQINSFVFGLISPHVGVGFEMHAPMLENPRNERTRVRSPLFIVVA